MSRIIGRLYAAGVVVLVLGGAAVVGALAIGRSQARLPLWLCLVGAVLLVPELFRKARQIRRRHAEALRQRREAGAQRAAAAAKEEQARRAQAQTRFNRFVEEDDAPLHPLPDPDQRIGLAPDEPCFAFAETAAHVTTRKSVASSRTHAPMILIKTGMRYEINAEQRNPLADLTERITDRGALCVSNRRIVFDGARETLNIPLEKVLQVHLDGNRIILLVQQQFHPVIFHIGDRYQAPVIAAAIFRLSRRLQESSDAATATSTTDDTACPPR